jgi:hypothetical protein
VSGYCEYCNESAGSGVTELSYLAISPSTSFLQMYRHRVLTCTSVLHTDSTCTCCTGCEGRHS